MTGHSNDLPPDEDRELGQFIPLHYHFHMLQDETRTTAFRDAIRELVKPGTKVLELGGGTGIMSWLAASCGADVIYVERNPALVRCARKFLAKNPTSGSVQIVHADARDYLPPTPVDVVICEMLHVCLLREKQLGVINAFKRSYLEAYGPELPVFIPEVTNMMVQPVGHSFSFLGYNAPVPVFQHPSLDNNSTPELGELVSYAQVFYGQPYTEVFDCDLTLTILEPGELTALRFVTQSLLAEIAEPQSYRFWANQFLVLPIENPMPVNASDILRVRFKYAAGDPLEQLSETLQVEAVSTGGA
jgi:type I protein arginine methyltransferase